MTVRSRPLFTTALLLCVSGALAACGGGGKLSPDEFEVVDRAPLVIPPESELRPPRPGEPRAQEIDPGQQAYDALFPGKRLRRQTPPSDGESAVLLRLFPSEPDVRSNVAQKDLEVVKKALLLSDLLEADDRQFRPDNILIERLRSEQGGN